ncbi:hypothetical protein BCR35DRAFT_307774 [Leucosporidium creatinivorum]|uniref:Proteophosphoglycan ppg4 n=1 Tax=Leucosporidium creatinivorum TaxID=106004 RepID=A0A1Y2EKY3_9BASI|nr:hypothetical protein BCR35DRAFT_307774 [Leucosporidium creatinivorum]
MARAPSPETSPEVDFGAFLRPKSRNGVARPISPPRPVFPSPTQQKLGAQPHGRTRQGAPRLGGLGLGGIQSSPSPFPSPPASNSPKKKPAPPSQVEYTTPNPPLCKHESAVVGRPFLSPEMEKPTLREGAFALDRPVPDLGTSTTPPPSEELPTPDSPSPQPSPFLGLSPPTSPTLDRLGALSAHDQVNGKEGGEDEHQEGFGMMDEVLGLVEAELMGQEGQVEMSSEGESESESEEEEDSSLASDSEEEEEIIDSKLPPTVPVETRARSPSPRPSVASLDSFHSLATPLENDVESSDSEMSIDGPQTPPPSIPPTLGAEAVVLVEEPTRSIDEVLLSNVSGAKAETPTLAMERQPSNTISDSSSASSDLAPPSPRSANMSRATSRSTSRGRAPPPPRPPRARRPAGSSTQTSPALSQATFEGDEGSASAEKDAEMDEPTEQKEKTVDLTTETTASGSPSRPNLPLHSHSANSSLSMSSQPSESFFFAPPPSHRQGAAIGTTTLPQPSAPVVAGYEGLGLRLPSSLRPKSFYADPESTPMASPTASAASPPLFPPPPVALAREARDETVTSATLPPSTSTSHQPAITPSVPAEPAPSSAPAFAASPTSYISPPSLPSPLAIPSASPTPAPSAGDLSSPHEGDSGLADIGVAAVGALVTGGMAVGYSAWRGLSAAASAGWGWKSAAPVMEQTTSVDEEEEDSETRLPGSLARDEEAKDKEGEDTRGEKVEEQTEVDSSVISTEWGEVAFPAPEGFIEAFKEAMAQLGPEELAANEKVELDAQEAAHDLALQLHLDSSRPLSSTSTFSTSPLPSRPFPGPPTINKRASMISLSSRRTSDRDGDRGLDPEGDEYDELMELVSPLFGTRIADGTPASRYAPSVGSFEGGRPLSRTLSGSTESSVSSRIPPSFSASGSTPSFKTAPRSPPTSKGSFFSFGKRRPSIDSSLAPPAPSSASTSSHRRALSIDSGSSDSAEAAAKLKRRSSLFGGSSIKSSATLSPPISSSSPIESQIVDTTYVSYSSGKSSRRRNSSASASSLSPSPSSPPPLPPLPPSFSKGSTRRSSIRLESRYTENASPPREKKIYTVRFANADRGIGLRSVAEDEALRAGGGTHALKWVGVGRGDRYGNLRIQTDAETDEAYAEQVAEIKTKWRRFGGAQRGEQRDWARVKID